MPRRLESTISKITIRGYQVVELVSGHNITHPPRAHYISLSLSPTMNGAAPARHPRRTPGIAVVNSSDDETDDESLNLDEITVAPVTRLDPLVHDPPLPVVSFGSPIADLKLLVDTCDRTISKYTEDKRVNLLGRKRLLQEVNDDIDRLRTEEEQLQIQIDQTRAKRRRREDLKDDCVDAIERCEDQWDRGLNNLQTPAVRHARTILIIYENRDCPITGEPMLEDGVVAADGNMYQRLAVNQALTIRPDTSPLTNSPMRGTLNEARAMCSAIRALTPKSN